MREEIKFLDSIQQLIKELSEKISAYKIAKSLEMHTPMIYKIIRGMGGNQSLTLLTKVKKFGYIPAIVFIPADNAQAYQAIEMQNRKALEDIKNKILEDIDQDKKRRESKKTEKTTKTTKTEINVTEEEVIHEIKPVTDVIKDDVSKSEKKEIENEVDIFEELNDLI